MKKVNKTIGNHFEAELCNILFQYGFWAHNLSQDQTGQPADVFAAKDDIAVLIDCKVCDNFRFPLSRIEGNQEGAMTLWEIRGNTHCYFAMKTPDGEIYMVHYDQLCERALLNAGAITKDEFKKFPTIQKWVESFDENIHRQSN